MRGGGNSRGWRGVPRKPASGSKTGGETREAGGGGGGSGGGRRPARAARRGEGVPLPRPRPPACHGGKEPLLPDRLPSHACRPSRSIPHIPVVTPPRPLSARQARPPRSQTVASKIFPPRSANPPPPPPGTYP